MDAPTSRRRGWSGRSASLPALGGTARHPSPEENESPSATYAKGAELGAGGPRRRADGDEPECGDDGETHGGSVPDGHGCQGVSSGTLRPLATMADLDELALALPGTTKEVSEDGRPAYLAEGKMFAFHRGQRKDAVDPETGERLDDVLDVPRPRTSR